MMTFSITPALIATRGCMPADTWASRAFAGGASAGSLTQGVEFAGQLLGDEALRLDASPGADPVDSNIAGPRRRRRHFSCRRVSSVRARRRAESAGTTPVVVLFVVPAGCCC